MATAIGDLVIRLNARTGNFNKRMGLARAALHGVTAAARGMMVALGPIASVAGLIGAARAGETFNQKMRNSLAIMGDVSGVMQGEMRQAAFEVAKSTKFAASEAAEAYFFLASAGLDAKRSIAAIPQVALFAQAGMFDLSLATDLATDAQSALGLTVNDAAKNLENMTHVTDVLVKANTLANASVQQFSESLTNKAGAALKIVNKDIEEGVAVLAAFADQGIKGSDAGTALNIVMRDLQTKGIKNAAAFKAAGVAVYDATGDMNNMADIVGDLERKLDGMSDAQKKATLLTLGFADKSVIFIQTLIGMSDRIREYERALRDAGGTTKEVADKQLTPLQRGWAQLSGTVAQASAAIMLALGPAIESALKGMASVIAGTSTEFGILGSSITTAAERLQEWQKTLKASQVVGLKFMRWIHEQTPATQRLALGLFGNMSWEDAAAQFEKDKEAISKQIKTLERELTNLEGAADWSTTFKDNLKIAREEMEKMRKVPLPELLEMSEATPGSKTAEPAQRLLKGLQFQLDTLGFTSRERQVAHAAAQTKDFSVAANATFEAAMVLAQRLDAIDAEASREEKALDKAPSQTQLAGTMLKGSQAAYSTILASMNRGKQKKADTAAIANEKHNAEAAASLRKLAENPRELTPIPN